MIIKSSFANPEFINTIKHYWWRFQYKLEPQNRNEMFWQKLAWHVPKNLAYWCAIRVIANATQGKHSNQNVPELTAMDALKRWRD